MLSCTTWVTKHIVVMVKGKALKEESISLAKKKFVINVVGLGSEFSWEGKIGEVKLNLRTIVN